MWRTSGVDAAKPAALAGTVTRQARSESPSTAPVTASTARETTPPTRKNRQSVARSVGPGARWYTRATGGPPMPEIVPMNPAAAPAPMSVRRRRPQVPAGHADRHGDEHQQGEEERQLALGAARRSRGRPRGRPAPG